MRDATQRSARARTEDSDKPRLWLIEPNAAPDDSWWQGRQIWQLVVAAPSAAFARLAAERWALRQRQVTHIGNESPSMSAGFIDEKLYFVRPLPENVGPKPEEFEETSVLVLAGPMPSRANA
jgi:uncharacterized membrane-anchored protein